MSRKVETTITCDRCGDVVSESHGDPFITYNFGTISLLGGTIDASPDYCGKCYNRLKEFKRVALETDFELPARIVVKGGKRLRFGLP